MKSRRITLLALAVAASAPALAQTDVNRVDVELTPSRRASVTTSVERPLDGVLVSSHRDLYCARLRALVDSASGMDTAKPHLDFRFALYRRLSTMGIRAMQEALQSAERSATREEQAQALFGMYLPPPTGPFDELVLPSGPLMIDLSAAQQAQLNMGQELLVSIFDLQGKPIDFGCLTVPQVDAAIAEGKRVYKAVIAAKAGGSAKGGLTTSAPTLSGPQTQDPKVK